MIAKSEDLPGMKLLSHESLAENMQIRIRKGVFSLRILRGLFDFLSGFGCMAASPVPHHAPNDRKERNIPMNITARRTANIKKLLGAGLLLLLLGAFALVHAVFAKKPVSGSKSITITVVNADAQEKEFPLKTDAQYLLGAMEEAEGLTFEGTEGPYGMMITEVNGERAVYDENGAYWGFSVNGEYCNYGIDQQPVHDGDAFTIAYTR